MHNTIAYGFRKIFCWILFLQMINLSIDPPQVDAVFQTKTPRQAAATVTERETVYEYVSEELLALDIPDTEEPEVEKSVHAFELYYSSLPLFTLATLELPLRHISIYANRFSCWESMPHAPPPKA